MGKRSKRTWQAARFPVAVSLGALTLAQAALLTWIDGIPGEIPLQTWLVAGVVASLAATAWRVRASLPAHTDMILLMLAWGGFGMLLGWHLDGATDAFRPDSGAAEIQAHAHLRPGEQTTPDVQEHQHHETHDHKHDHGAVYTGWFRWLNGMNLLMLAFAFPPSVLWARCLKPYRPFTSRLAAVLALDAVGMVLGMMGGARLLGHPLGESLGAPMLAHHIGMLAGMLAGMYATMLLRRWLVPLPRI
jgi:hypothetical protein